MKKGIFIPLIVLHTKPATLEGGAVVNVPFHIQNGDLLKIDTRTNEYLGKA